MTAVQKPAIAIVKEVAPASFSAPGTATFTYTVTNPGNVALTGVTVKDDNGTPLNPADDFVATYVSGDINSNSKLEKTETWTYTAVRSITQVMIDTGIAITNIGTADSNESGPATDDATITFTQFPAYTIKKSVTETQMTAPGDLHYRVVLTNTANVSLTNISLDDSLVGVAVGTPVESGNTNSILDVGENWTWTYTYSVTQAMINAGTTIHNVATGDCAELEPITSFTDVPIVKPAKGTLQVVKETTNSDGSIFDANVLFEFIATGENGLPSIFSIETSGGTGSQTFTVTPGTYSITETSQSDWKLDTVTIDGTQVTNGDSFTVDPGSTVTVTFKNEWMPTPPVPELPAGSLLGIGLLGLIGFVMIKRHTRVVLGK